jgi:uncharacterized protein YjiS (DUF1127 family)
MLLMPLLATAVPHSLTMIHPGDPEANLQKLTLHQTLDDAGDPTGYAMWVDSVICRSKACEVVKVQLHWDAIGRYQRYMLAFGSQLTKLDHVPFTEADHAKLQRILKDLNSPLAEVDKDGMTGKSKAVDGVSGATVLTLKNNVVLGAGYCCYDLWHWANGATVAQIRALTARSISPTALQAYLRSEDQAQVRFALEALSTRQLRDSATVEAVIAAPLAKPLVEPALAYLRAAAPDFPDAFLQIFAKADSDTRVALLEQLQAHPIADSAFHDRLCDYLPSLASYLEAHLFFRVIRSRRAIEQTLPLLQHEKFFVARRAFWFLDEQDLPAAIRDRVDAFYDAHEDRL